MEGGFNDLLLVFRLEGKKVFKSAFFIRKEL